ncbi:MAG: hypothetical protein AAGI52_08415 [Bacteroidota bacterium]
MRLSLFLAVFALLGLSACDTAAPEVSLDSAVTEVVSADKAALSRCIIQGPNSVRFGSTTSYQLSNSTSCAGAAVTWTITGNGSLACEFLQEGETDNTTASKSSTGCPGPSVSAVAGSPFGGSFTLRAEVVTTSGTIFTPTKSVAVTRR